jgi:hypothetical protein
VTTSRLSFRRSWPLQSRRRNEERPGSRNRRRGRAPIGGRILGSNPTGEKTLMEALRILDFVTVAIKRSGRWILLLDFWPTDVEEDDWSWLSYTLPWLPSLGADRGRVCGELRRHGLALVACVDEEEARRLLDQIQGFRVGAKVFTDTGAETHWGSLQCPSLRPEGGAERPAMRAPGSPQRPMNGA